MKEKIKDLLSKGYTPIKIIEEMNLDKTQAYVSLIERIQRYMKVSASTTIPEKEVGPQANGGG